MKLRRPPPLAILIALAVAATAAWFVLAPRSAYRSFLRALAVNDGVALERTVDFTELRSNFKRDFATVLSARSGAQPGQAPQLQRLVDSMAGAAVTPAGLNEIVTSFTTSGATQPNVELSAGAAPVDLPLATKFRIESLARVDVHVYPVGIPERQAGIFTFARQGMQWRLVRIWSEAIAAAESP